MVPISTLLEKMTGSDRAATIGQVRFHARIALTGMFIGSAGTLLLVGWMPWGNLTFPLIVVPLLVAWFSHRTMIRRSREALRSSEWGRRNAVTLPQLRHVGFDPGIWDLAARDTSPEALH
ncbi:hypothetical protein OVA24_03080 [Luteolibacter sp. SL250]|uniref:hypothetical protein n=1 Tax=Luteolibacter sp. SL250 TaxID=2995170 RepID=UPI00226D5AEB|nr:hypothetical protein [Luteolibacter sp. SL250]WAC20360.1 hypothetical protein OVA24_03080 [Luteolibacter sp. SL250]